MHRSLYAVSGASQLGHHVRIYLLKEGAPVDLFLGSGTDDAAAGFSADQAKLSAKYLLGAGLDDWRPQKIVVCENSLAVFLKEVAKRLFHVYSITYEHSLPLSSKYFQIS